jgi:hypothetical protein
MKYIITESKLDQIIYDYLDELFTSKDGDTELYKIPSIDENGDDHVGSYDIVNNDYYERDGDHLVTWTDKEYYESIHPEYITKDEMEKQSKMCPVVEIRDFPIVRQLKGYFGDLWIPVFGRWFTDKTGLPIKTLYSNDSYSGSYNVTSF